MFDSILVICTGNICRSPIGERLLRQLLPNKRIDSAGVGALVNHAADESAIRVAKKMDFLSTAIVGQNLPQYLPDSTICYLLWNTLI